MEQRRGKNDQGVIMLETLLSLPLYIVMLACLFWLGELCMTRLTLTNAERLRLWEKGNWNDHSEKAETEIFRFLSFGTIVQPVIVTGESDFSNTFAATLSANNWGNLISGYATVNTRRSVWSWGITDFAKRNLWSGTGANASDGTDTLLMRSRVNTDDNSLPLTMFFRAGDGGRKVDLSNGAPRTSNWDNSTNWHSIYLGRWENAVVPENVGSASGVRVYNRNSFYLNWSL